MRTPLTTADTSRAANPPPTSGPEPTDAPMRITRPGSAAIASTTTSCVPAIAGSSSTPSWSGARGCSAGAALARLRHPHGDDGDERQDQQDGAEAADDERAVLGVRGVRRSELEGHQHRLERHHEGRRDADQQREGRAVDVEGAGYDPAHHRSEAYRPSRRLDSHSLSASKPRAERHVLAAPPPARIVSDGRAMPRHETSGGLLDPSRCGRRRRRVRRDARRHRGQAPRRRRGGRLEAAPHAVATRAPRRAASTPRSATRPRTTPEIHTFDTVKGSDYLGDQDAIEIMCREAPGDIYELEHMGAIFTRFPDGRLAQRPFGAAGAPAPSTRRTSPGTCSPRAVRAAR